MPSGIMAQTTLWATIDGPLQSKELTIMLDAHAALQRFADALEAKANASNQDEDDIASDDLTEAIGDVERNAAEVAALLRRLPSTVSGSGS